MVNIRKLIHSESVYPRLNICQTLSSCSDPVSKKLLSCYLAIEGIQGILDILVSVLGLTHHLLLRDTDHYRLVRAM